MGNAGSKKNSRFQSILLDSLCATCPKTRHAEPVGENPSSAMQKKPLKQMLKQTKIVNFKKLFRLGKELGKGCSGAVFLCVEKATGKQYACKLIQKRKISEDKDVKDLATEIQIMHHLARNPNVASIKGSYEDSDAFYIVMELCRGGELSDRVKQRGRYTESEAAELIRTIVTAVQSLHSSGIMHRDLKLANFLFVNEDQDSPLKIIDFGFSTFFQPGEKFSEALGTPYYIAPEVLNKNYGPEADIWSIGVILYVLLSGASPFSGKTNVIILEKVLYGNIDFSPDPWPAISESAKDLVRKMLDRNPATRITTSEVLCHRWFRTND